MSTQVKEMAMMYYPRLWNERRLQTLVTAGRMTQEEMDEIIASHKNIEDVEYTD